MLVVSRWVRGNNQLFRNIRQMQFKALIMIILGIAVCSSVFGASNSDRRTVPSAAEAARSQGGGYPKSDGFEEFKQGQAYGNQQQYEKAIEAFNKAESKGLKLYELFVFRGYAYHETKQYQKAISDASKAIELEAARMLAYELRAGVHYTMGNADEAIKELTNGLTKVEGAEKAKLQKARGITFLMLGRREDAISDLSQAIALGHASAVLYYNRGRAYKELGRYELALQDFSEALKLEPGHNRSLGDRGWVYACIGELEKGVEDLNQLLAKSSEDVLAHGMRGWVRLEIGDVEGGLADLVYALEHGSNDPMVFLNAASAYYLKDNMTKALKVNGQGLAIKDSDRESVLQFQRGIFLLVSGQKKEAARFYKKAKTAAFKRSERIEMQEAIADLKEAIQLHPHIADAAVAILKELEKTLSQTQASRQPRPEQCQRLRSRDE
jgi:tetratricopeptide (TPR) repeat protein